MHRYKRAMQQLFLDTSSHSAYPAVSSLRFTDRFEPDREKLAAIYSRLGRKRAEKKIIEDLGSISELAALIQSRYEHGRHLEIDSTLAVFRDFSEQLGLVPLVAAADALAGALEGENPHAIRATLARLRRVADRAQVGIWSFCS